MNLSMHQRDLNDAQKSWDSKDRSTFRIEDDVLIWNSNNRHPMDDLMSRWLELGLVTDAQYYATEVARDEQNALFIEEYKLNQAKRSEEQIAEERFEARAAMGPDVDMVNIITGEKWNTSGKPTAEKVQAIAPQTTTNFRYTNKRSHAAHIIESIGLDNRKSIIAEMVDSMGVTKANAGVYIYNYKKANNI